MRYLLVVGFACDVYRREPRARIFVGDKLLDEFNILHDSSEKTDSAFNFPLLDPHLRIKFFERQIRNFPSLRFYEVEIDKNMDEVILRINIENNDNNYTNGFISKSTLIKLQVCMFFPIDQKLLNRLSKIIQKNFLKNFAWVYSSKNDIFNLFHTGCVKWIGYNEKKNMNNFPNNLYNHNVGGNGDFIGNLSKKYGIYLPKIKKSYRFNFNRLLINYMLDKYVQYANR